MTLILSLATPDYIVQASDRRLTVGSGPRIGELVDDDSNKVTLFCNRMSFAYTGLAAIDGKRTDIWMVDILSKVIRNSTTDAWKELIREANSSFSNMQDKRIKRQAFVGIGWVRGTPIEPLQPIICTVSNALNNDLDWLPEATDQFRMQSRLLRAGRPYLFVATGQRLPHNIRRDLERNFKKIAGRRIGPLAIGRLLAEAIWDIASQNNAVGSNLMLVNLPKIAVENSRGFISAQMPDENSISFAYISPDNPAGVFYGPNVVCGGEAIVGFEFGPITNEDREDRPNKKDKA